MIYYFNPGHEVAVLNLSPYYTLPANLLLMQKELSFLPIWYAKEEKKIVLVDTVVEASFLNTINTCFNINVKAVTEKSISGLDNEEVSLWGISPQAIFKFEKINAEYNLNFKIPKWNDKYKYLTGRRAGKDCLEKLVDKDPLFPKTLLPTFYSSLEEIEEAVNKSPYPLLAKAPYSSAGRGVLRLPFQKLTRTERQILQGILNKQGEVSIERKLNRIVDFAMEFTANRVGELIFASYSLFKTTDKGAYSGNYLDTQENIENLLHKYISDSTLSKVKESLTHQLEDTYLPIYKGCIGVDMLIYEQDNTFHLHPCIEINMRYNMGYLANCFYENYISKSSSGFFHIEFLAQKGEAYKKHLEMAKLHPTIFIDNKLSEGYFSLCPVDENNHYISYVIVEKKILRKLSPSKFGTNNSCRNGNI